MIAIFYYFTTQKVGTKSLKKLLFIWRLGLGYIKHNYCGELKL